MKGSIVFHKKLKRYYVSWYHNKKTFKIYRYIDGQFLYDKRQAEKLRALMQADVERNCFNIERYTKNHVEVVQYLKNWIDIVSPNLSPATVKDYENSIKNHLIPYFDANPCMLHEVRLDVLQRLLNSIKRVGKGKQNVMYCLHACLDFAWRSEHITHIPPFPKKADYKIIDPPINWLSSEEQRKIIETIPIKHQPIFWFLKYTLRRPAEAMALQKSDYNSKKGIFTIRRSISNRQLVERTKTGQIHLIPCPSQLKTIIDNMPNVLSPFFFYCRSSRSGGGRYTHSILSKQWNKAARKNGFNIKMYAGLKHSSCCQYVNEKGLSESELQVITDHARLDSVKKYVKTGMARKLELMETKIVPINRKQKVG